MPALDESDTFEKIDAFMKRDQHGELLLEQPRPSYLKGTIRVYDIGLTFGVGAVYPDTRMVWPIGWASDEVQQRVGELRAKEKKRPRPTLTTAKSSRPTF